MCKALLSSAIFTMCGAVLVAASVCGAAGEPARKETAEEGQHRVLPFSSLKLILRCPRTACVLGEPIVACVTLRNPHDLPAEAHDGWGWFCRGGSDFGEGDLYLSLTLQYEWKEITVRRPYGMGWATREPPQPVLIEPGGIRRAKLLLVYAGDVRRFIVPGPVTLRATFMGPDGQARIESNAVRLTIRRPKGENERRFRWLDRLRLFRYLGYVYFMRFSFNDGDIDLLESLAKGNPDSPYALHAAFAAGQMYFYRRWYDEAAAALKRVVERYPKSPIADDALYLVGESYRRQKKFVEADKWFREVIRRYPDTVAADDAKVALAQIAEQPEMLFRKDRRLDREVRLDLPFRTSTQEALRVVSRLTGVPLGVARELEETPIARPIQKAITVRVFMAEFHVFHRGRWVRDGDGYRLVPVGAPNK